jgi:hypothetical protein
VISATLSAHAFAQEGILETEIIWGAQQAPSQNWMAYLALIGPTGREVQTTLFEPCSNWPTADWNRGMVARGYSKLRIDPFIARGVYTVMVGLIDPVIGAKAGAPVAMGQVEVQAIERSFETPEIKAASEATFGADLRLLGYALEQTSEQIVITLHWQALRRMDTSYKFFAHLIDVESEKLVAQADVIPYDWTYPTTWWEVDEIVSDEIVLSLKDASSGTFRLEIGVYDPDSGTRLTLTDGQGVDRFIVPEIHIER